MLKSELVKSSIFQLRIRAFDGGRPSLSSTVNSEVIISVERNSQIPFFLAQNFQITIDEDTPRFTSVFQFLYDDNDINVSVPIYIER